MKFENIDAYRYLASVYDNMSKDIQFEDWGKYLVSFFDKPKPAVLEYACGTGNITKTISNYCSSIMCLDISPEMLLKAQEKFQRSNLDIKFIECDMKQFVLNEPADYIVCACDGVNYLTKKEELNLFFKNAYSNLKTDGTFLFDVSSDYKLKNILGNEFFYTDDDNETLFWNNSYNEDNSIVEMNLTLFLKQGKVYYRYDEAHYQRAWTIKEIREALISNGFSDVYVFSFGTLNKPEQKDMRIQFVAKK